MPTIAGELSYMNWPQSGALLGAGFAVMAVLLLAISPVGWLAGWWHYSFAFRLMAASGVAASAAAIVSLLTLMVGWSELNVHDVTITGVALALGVALAYVPWQYNRTLSAVPRIHDISTDTENPPPFLSVLPARAAEHAATVVYEGPKLARLQKAAYPDVWCRSRCGRLRQRYSSARLKLQRQCRAGRLLPPSPPLAALRPARGAVGSASPTTLSSALAPRAQEAASICARPVDRGAVTSVSMQRASAAI